jgi:hypothetical protein
MAYCSYTVFVKIGEMVHIHDNLIILLSFVSGKQAQKLEKIIQLLMQNSTQG